MDPERRERLGQRWVCHACEARFYDLRRPEPHCPRCGADPREAPAPEKPKRVRARKSPKARKAPKAAMASSGTAAAGPAKSAAREMKPEEEAPSPIARGRRSPAGKKAALKAKAPATKTKAARTKGQGRAKKATRRDDASSAVGDPDKAEEGASTETIDLGDYGDSHIEEDLGDA